MNYENRQVWILGKFYKLYGQKGDVYFESHLDEAGKTERDVINILAASISSSDVVLDVGANIGYISLAMSALAAKGKVFAFEPAKDTYKILERNISENGIKNVKLFDLGLSDHKGQAKLSYSTNNSSGAFVNDGVMGGVSGYGSDVIKLRRLDDEYIKLGIKKCELLKVDVEGHEPNFLRGATKFIHKFKPQVVMEVNHWCLNVFNRTSLPDFIDYSFSIFPHLFAIHEGSYIDLSNEGARTHFYYENVVKNNFLNVYGGFDKNDMIANLNQAYGGWNESREALEDKVKNLEQQLELLKNSKPQRAAAKINKIIRR